MIDELRRGAHDSGFAGGVPIGIGEDTAICEAFGLADRAHGGPHTVGSRIGVASGAKVLTALTVMCLVEQGALALDQPVRPVLGSDLPLLDYRVTVRQLLSHRSGIGDYLDEDATGSITDYVMAVPVHQLADTEDYLAVLDGHPM